MLNGIESLDYFAPKISSVVPRNMTSSSKLNILKNKIKNSSTKECRCKQDIHS